MSKFFIGSTPTECQLCHAPIKDVFIDGRIRGTGQWGYMCPSCHKAEGVGFGVGKGQKYASGVVTPTNPEGKFVKIEG